MQGEGSAPAGPNRGVNRPDARKTCRPRLELGPPATPANTRVAPTVERRLGPHVREAPDGATEYSPGRRVASPGSRTRQSKSPGRGDRNAHGQRPHVPVASRSVLPPLPGAGQQGSPLYPGLRSTVFRFTRGYNLPSPSGTVRPHVLAASQGPLSTGSRCYRGDTAEHEVIGRKPVARIRLIQVWANTDVHM